MFVQRGQGSFLIKYHNSYHLNCLRNYGNLESYPYFQVTTLKLSLHGRSSVYHLTSITSFD